MVGSIPPVSAEGFGSSPNIGADFMKTLTTEQLKEYLKDTLSADEKVRKWCNVPEDKYYSVSVWPEHLAGRVWLTPNMVRKVPAKKISKSDQ